MFVCLARPLAGLLLASWMSDVTEGITGWHQTTSVLAEVGQDHNRHLRSLHAVWYLTQLAGKRNDHKVTRCVQGHRECVEQGRLCEQDQLCWQESIRIWSSSPPLVCCYSADMFTQKWYTTQNIIQQARNCTKLKIKKIKHLNNYIYGYLHDIM